MTATGRQPLRTRDRVLLWKNTKTEKSGSVARLRVDTQRGIDPQPEFDPQPAADTQTRDDTSPEVVPTICNLHCKSTHRNQPARGSRTGQPEK